MTAKQITNPGGYRAARADGVPLRAYRHDRLSGGYHRTRVDHGADARAWPLLSKQHSAHPRTDQAESQDVARPAENNQPPS